MLSTFCGKYLDYHLCWSSFHFSWLIYFRPIDIHICVWHCVPVIMRPWLLQIMACRLFAANLRQAIVWTNQANVDLLLIRPSRSNFSKTQRFSFKKIHLKMSSAKCQPFCLILNVLHYISNILWMLYYSWFIGKAWCSFQNHRNFIDRFYLPFELDMCTCKHMFSMDTVMDMNWWMECILFKYIRPCLIYWPEQN